MIPIARHCRHSLARLLLRADEEVAEEDEEEDELDESGCTPRFRADDAVDTRDATLWCASSPEAPDNDNAVDFTAAESSWSRATCSAGLVCIANTWQRLMVGPHIDLSDAKSSGRTHGIELAALDEPLDKLRAAM